VCFHLIPRAFQNQGGVETLEKTFQKMVMDGLTDQQLSYERVISKIFCECKIPLRITENI